MATTTDLTTLKINYLTQAQYDNALANNQINSDELYFTPADDGVTINLNGQNVQSPSFYAPTGGGTAGNFLKSGGSSAAPTWAALTSSEVITALGFTPYNSTNPNGYTTNTGTVTSVQVQATSPVVSSTNTAQTGTLNTTISLADGYGDTKNPYASKTKNYVLAAPSSANGAPSFRALVADDIPTLSITDKTSGTLTIARGGTGKTSWDINKITYASAANTLGQLAHASSTSYLLKSGSASAAPSWIQYTNANTASTIVQRDSSGNFSAGTITATLSGDVYTNKINDLDLGAVPAAGTASQMAYYSADNIISGATYVRYYEGTSTANTPANIRRLHIYGNTYGNTAANMISGTAGLFSYGDGGPQITFDYNAAGTGQPGALIYTDNDTAATGSSWHFVSSQSDWNVTSKRFHARTGISIGTDLPSRDYNLYVEGTSRFGLGSSDNTSNKKFIIGSSGERYLSFGGAGVQAYNASDAVSTLHLNYSGGPVYIGNGVSASSTSSELRIKGRVVVDLYYHSTNSFSEFRINRASNGWSGITLGGAKDSLSATGLGIWLVGAKSGTDATTEPANITDSQFYISYNGSNSATCRIQGHNATGFSIRPRLAINTDVNTTNYNYHLYVNGTAAISNTLYLTRTTDASGTVDNKPALMIGSSTGQHIEIDGNEILSKSNATTPGTLYLQDGTGSVIVAGSGGLGSSGNVYPNTTKAYDLGSSDKIWQNIHVGYIDTYAVSNDGTATRYNEIIGYNAAGTLVSALAYDMGNATNITTGRWFFQEYSPNSTANTSTTGKYEWYQLPAVTAGLTANKTYDILTSKNAVTIAQGGTGATTRLDAAKNLTYESVPTPTHVVGLTTSWAKFGYTTIAQLKTTLGINAGSMVQSQYLVREGTGTTSYSMTFNFAPDIIISLTSGSTDIAVDSYQGTLLTGAYNFNNNMVFMRFVPTGTYESALSSTAEDYTTGDFFSGLQFAPPMIKTGLFTNYFPYYVNGSSFTFSPNENSGGVLHQKSSNGKTYYLKAVSNTTGVAYAHNILNSSGVKYAFLALKFM